MGHPEPGQIHMVLGTVGRDYDGADPLLLAVGGEAVAINFCPIKRTMG